MNPDAHELRATQEIANIREMTEEVSAALRRQQELLKVRNLALPSNVLQTLTNFDVDLARAAQWIANDRTEQVQLRTLAQTSALINSSFDLDMVLASAMDAVIRLTGAERGFILLVNHEGDLEFRVARSVAQNEDDSTPDFDDVGSVSRTILHEVLHSRMPLLTDNASRDPRMKNSKTVSKFTLRSVLCAPLLFKGQASGAVYVDNRFRDAVFGERELNLLTAFANQIAISIENARLFSNVSATLREITEASALLESVFSSIASGVITTDAQDMIITCNDAARAPAPPARLRG
jgi:adenylate cyclase